MAFGHLKRNRERVLNAIYKTPNGEYIAKEELQIILPVRFEESNLMEIEKDTYTLGIFAIVVGDSYATNVTPARMRMANGFAVKEKYLEDEYYVFTFEKGATIFYTNQLLKEETLGYYIYNYFVALGRMPWYMKSTDIIKLFDNCGYFTGKTYGVNHVIMEMIMSTIMRNPLNNKDYWRHTLKSQQDVKEKEVEVIALRNVPLGARNTTAKLMGAYFTEGLNSALIYPSDTTEVVEELLRQ